MRIGFDAHQLIDLHRARHAHTRQIVAFQIDQHHVFGTLFRMPDQFTDLGGLVIARHARARARDRPRLHAAGLDADQTLRGRTQQGPIGNAQQTGERRRIHPAQARIKGIGIGTGEPAVPGPRQIDLEHIAGFQVIQYACDT